MKTKICKGKLCRGGEKPISAFSKDKRSKDGLIYKCKECIKEIGREYYDKNKEKIKLRNKKYREENPEYLILWHIKQRCYNKKSKDYKYYGLKGIKNFLTLDDIRCLMKRDNYYKLKKPSIDRMDNKGNYTLENCQFIEHSKNSRKDNVKPISQYDLDGKFIREFESINSASNFLKCSHSLISLAVNGKIDKAKNYKWKYK